MAKRLPWKGGKKACALQQDTASFAGMSASNAPPARSPEELRPLLHAAIDRLPDEQLAAAHRFLLELEIQSLIDTLDEGAERARAAGRMTPESIRESILEHRRKHPYR